MSIGDNLDSFSDRLTKELAALAWIDRTNLLISIGKMELRMRRAGVMRPNWKGPAPETNILGADVVVPTDSGERRGRVVCFGVINTGDEFERSVVVHVPSSGTQYEVPGSMARLASPEDSARIKNELEMAARLAEAAALVQQGPAPVLQEKVKRRGQKDPRLLEQMLEAANASSSVHHVESGAVNNKIVGLDPDKRIYLFKTQLRVDVSGYSFDHPGLRKISDAEAKEMHLGKVRGQIIFDDRESALAAFQMALVELGKK